MEAKKVSHLGAKRGHYTHWAPHPGTPGLGWGGRGGTTKQNATRYLTRHWAVGPANLLLLLYRFQLLSLLLLLLFLLLFPTTSVAPLVQEACPVLVSFRSS